MSDFLEYDELVAAIRRERLTMCQLDALRDKLCKDCTNKDIRKEFEAGLKACSKAATNVNKAKAKLYDLAFAEAETG